jgi:hypothetical protein
VTRGGKDKGLGQNRRSGVVRHTFILYQDPDSLHCYALVLILAIEHDHHHSFPSFPTYLPTYTAHDVSLINKHSPPLLLFPSPTILPIPIPIPLLPTLPNRHRHTQHNLHLHFHTIRSGMHFVMFEML